MENASLPGGWSAPQPVGPLDDDEAVTGSEVHEGDEPPGVALLEQGVRVAAGLVALGIVALADAIRATMPVPPASDEPATDRVDPVGLAAGAALGLTLLVGERTARIVGRVSQAVGPPASWFAGVPPLGPAANWARATARSLDDRWRDERPGAERAATAFARELVPQVIDAVLDQIDLTWLVAERVDIDELVARVDLDKAVSRVDLDTIVARLDLNDIAARIDVDAVVARVDIDQIAQRVDVGAVIERLDLAELTRAVLDEIDLPEIIRESTGSVASETVRGVRMQGIEADASVSRAVDRILRRRRPRDLDAPDEPGSPQATPPAEDAGSRS